MAGRCVREHIVYRRIRGVRRRKEVRDDLEGADGEGVPMLRQGLIPILLSLRWDVVSTVAGREQAVRHVAVVVDPRTRAVASSSRTDRAYVLALAFRSFGSSSLSCTSLVENLTVEAAQSFEQRYDADVRAAYMDGAGLRLCWPLAALWTSYCREAAPAVICGA